MKKPNSAPSKDGYHHIGVRLLPAQYRALEQIRERRGFRSLNLAVNALIEDAGK